MSQQYETQINNLLQKYQQQILEFEATVQAKHNEMVALKNQLSFLNSQQNSYTTPPPQPNPTYPPHSPMWQHQTTQPQYMNHTMFDMLNQSFLQQAQASKEHFLSSAKICDGTNPKEFESWLEEISRLTSVSGKTDVEIAIFTSRGSLYNHIK